MTIEEHLKKILATEVEADKIEETARAEADKILADANKKAQELLAQAERHAQERLKELHARAEAEGQAEAEKLDREQEKLLQSLQGRYKDLHDKIIKEANIDLSSILTLAKE